MKTIVNKTLEALIILSCIIILALFVPLIISLILIISTDVTFINCVTSTPLILLTIAGILIASIYVNDVVTRN